MGKSILGRALAAGVVLLGTLTGCGTSATGADADASWRHFNVGVGYMAEAKYPQAQSEFDSALALNPHEGRILTALGQSLANQAKNDSAIMILGRTALPEAAYARALVSLRAGRNEEAVAALEDLAGSKGADECTDAGAAYLMGVAQGRLGDTARSIEYLRRSTDIEPHLISAAYALAQAYQRAGRQAKADSVMQRFAYLRDNGGTSIDLNGDIGVHNQGALGDIPVPGHRRIAAPDTLALQVAGLTFPEMPEGYRWTIAHPADFDGDGMTDLVLGSEQGVRFWRNAGEGTFEDVTAATGLPATLTDGGVTDVACGDFDRDGNRDLIVAQWGRTTLWRGRTRSGTPSYRLHRDDFPGARQIALLDADHDGWLDMLLVPAGEHHGPGAALGLVYYRNRGDGSLVDRTQRSGLGETALAPHLSDREGITGVSFGDFDHDTDTDLLLGFREGAPLWLENQHDGRFVRAGSRAPELTEADAMPETATERRYDLDLDGVPELLALDDGHVLHISADDGNREDIATRTGVAAFAVAQFDTTDEIQLVVLGLDGVARGYSASTSGELLRLRLAGGSSVPDGRGARVDVAQGSVWQTRDVTSESDLLFGLDTAGPVDLVRVTWPSGIRQAVIAPSTDGVIVIDEKPGETSSCPFVYTWNGEEFEFIADAIGGGVIGVVEVPPDTYNYPDPDEYLRIRGDQLQAQGDSLSLRFVEVLSEATMVDEVRLYAVEHASDVEIHPAERMSFHVANTDTAIYRLRDAKPVARAYAGELDGTLHDVTDLLSQNDRSTVTPGRMLPYKGFASPHELRIDISDVQQDGPVILVWDGWTSFSSSASIAEAGREGIVYITPYLQAQNADGSWSTIIEDMGVPAGKSKTIFTDLTGKLPSGCATIRVITNMRVYWDRVRVTTRPLDREEITVTELPLRSAVLRYVGYPKADADAGRPYRYTYADRSDVSPWQSVEGMYTRYGPVEPLVRAFDDQYVIMNHGDEIAITFDAPPESDRSITYLLYMVGYMKEIIPRDPLLSVMEPLPYRDMPQYPYDDPADFYRDANRAAYAREWNTREVRN